MLCAAPRACRPQPAVRAVQAVLGTLHVPYQDLDLDFEQPFRRATMHDLVKEATGACVT